MSSPAIYHITNWEGDTFTLYFEVTGSDDVAVDLTGYSFSMTVRDKPGGSVWASTEGASPTLTVSLTEGANASPTDGAVQISGTISQTAASVGVYDVQANPSGSTIQTWIAGTFTVLSEVTS